MSRRAVFAMLLLLASFLSIAHAGRSQEWQYDKIRILSIGIKQYQDISNPKWADRDAETFIRSIKAASPDAQVEEILLLNENATLENIRAAMKDLRKSTNRDLVLVFFAGHGVIKAGKTKEPALVPYDYRKDVEAPPLYGLETLNYDLSLIRGASKVLFLDCCYSGAFNAGRNLAGYVPDMTISADDLNSKDWIFLSSCQSGEKSYAFDPEKQGFFTTALKYGIMGYADADGDGWVSMDELQKYSKEYVKELTTQHSQYNMKTLGQDGAEGILQQNPSLNTNVLDLDFRLFRAIPQKKREKLPGHTINVRIKVVEPLTARVKLYKVDDSNPNGKGVLLQDFPAERLYSPGLNFLPGDSHYIDIYDPENITRQEQGLAPYKNTQIRFIKFKPAQNPPASKIRLKTH